MDAQLHHDLAEFVAQTRPLLEGDPVRHTLALTVLALLLRVPEAVDPPVLLTVHRGEPFAGTAICTPPWALIVSVLPAWCAGAAVEVLALGYPSLPGAVGPRDEAEAFAGNWFAGQPVAWASASAPVAGMSRIAPVYTLPQHRGQGYGSAVTAAAAGWARQAGAKHVVLFTDQASPVPHVIYPRIGFRPVHDAVEFAFTPAVWRQNAVIRSRILQSASRTAVCGRARLGS